MAYNEYAITGFAAREQPAEAVKTNYAEYASLAMVMAMAYVLVIEKNIALFAVLFLMLAIFYNPTKFMVQGKLYDSEVIL